MKSFQINIVIVILASISINNVTSLFEAILTQGEPLYKNSDKLKLDELKIQRFNRTTFVLKGSIDILINDAEESDLLCIVFKKAGNDYKLMPYKYGPKKLCEFILEEDLFYPEFLLSTSNFPPLGSCDFKAGQYVIHDYLPDLSKVPPVFESGDYMLECQMKRGDEIVNGYKIYAQVSNYANAKPKKIGM